MWRQIVQARSASTGRRCCAPPTKRLGVPRRRPVLCSASTFPQAIASQRALSSAQPTPWDDGSPFLMSTAPSLAQMENPTAERVVMKTFLDTLQGTVVQSNPVETEPRVLAEPSFIETVVEEETTIISDDAGMNVVEEEQTSAVTVSLIAAHENETEHSTETTITSDENDAEQQSHGHASFKKVPFFGPLAHATRTKNAKEATRIYRECIQQNTVIPPNQLVQLFNLVVAYDPITALIVLRNNRRVNGEPAHSALYARLCQSVGTVHWKLGQSGQFTKTVHDLKDDLLGLDESYQRLCFPILLVSLVQQPMYRIGTMASGLYKFMVENDYPLSHGKMCHLLNVSRYTRQDDLSFPHILARLVDEGKRVLTYSYGMIFFKTNQTIILFFHLQDTDRILRWPFTSCRISFPTPM